MNDYDSRIKSLRPIGWDEIQNHYTLIFIDAIIELLNKLGYAEGMEFELRNSKKKKSRMSFRTQDVLGIKYSKFPTPQNSFYGKEFKYEFFIRYLTGDRNPNLSENIMVIPPTSPDIDFWSDLYNYLRIEARAKKQSK